jgi:hypothetical protein
MKFTTIALVLSTFCPAFVRADDSADAKAIIENGIKSIGTKTPDKPVAMTWKGKGTFTGGGFKLPFTADWAFQGPDRYRFKLNGEFSGMEIELLVIVNGDKAWESAMGQSKEMSGEKLKNTLSQVYQMNVMSLAPLLKDKDFKLSTAGEKDVGKLTTKVVKVTRDKQPAVTLYFDKESGLLAKSEMMVTDEFQGWKEVLSEGFYEDYKEVGGRKVFTKMRVVRDGKQVIESTLTDQKTHDKLEDKLFEKP